MEIVEGGYYSFYFLPILEFGAHEQKSPWGVCFALPASHRSFIESESLLKMVNLIDF